MGSRIVELTCPECEKVTERYFDDFDHEVVGNDRHSEGMGGYEEMTPIDTQCDQCGHNLSVNISLFYVSPGVPECANSSDDAIITDKEASSLFEHGLDNECQEDEKP